MKQHTFSIVSFLLICTLYLSSCRSGESGAVVSTKISAHEALDESYVTKLYTHYVALPELQAHKDENRIIDYILSQDLAYERTDSGLYYIIIKSGEGAKSATGGTRRMHDPGKKTEKEARQSK